jgi:hypothetical protein
MSQTETPEERQRRLEYTWNKLKRATNGLSESLHRTAEDLALALSLLRGQQVRAAQEVLQNALAATPCFLYCGFCGEKLCPNGFQGKQATFVGSCNHLFHAQNQRPGPTCFQLSHEGRGAPSCRHCAAAHDRLPSNMNELPTKIHGGNGPPGFAPCFRPNYDHGPAARLRASPPETGDQLPHLRKRGAVEIDERFKKAKVENEISDIDRILEEET